MRIKYLMLMAVMVSLVGCGKEEPAPVSSTGPSTEKGEPAVIGKGPEFACSAKMIGDARPIPYDPLKGVEKTLAGQLIVRSTNAETAKQALTEFFDSSGNRYEGGGSGYMDAVLHVSQGWVAEQCAPYADSVDFYEAKQVPLEAYQELKTQRDGIALWMKLQGKGLDPERGGLIWSRDAATKADVFARKDAALNAFESSAKPAIADANPNFIVTTSFPLSQFNMTTRNYHLGGNGFPIGKDKSNNFAFETVGGKDNSMYSATIIFDGGKEFFSYKPASEEEARYIESFRQRPLKAKIFAQAVKSNNRFSIIAVPMHLEVRDDLTDELLFTLEKS